MSFLITFLLLSLVNVIFSTVRSLTTINSGKTVASLISGAYFAFYNVMLIYTVADFPMWQKCLITFICNVVGVYIVKWVEEKSRKDKLWKVELALKNVSIDRAEEIKQMFNEANIPNNYQRAGKWMIFNCYCATKKETDFVAAYCKTCRGKISAYESKSLAL